MLYTALGRALPPSLERGRSLCVLEVLRGTSAGATMTIPGGVGTSGKAQFPRARRTGFYHRVGVSLVYFSPALRFATSRSPKPRAHARVADCKNSIFAAANLCPRTPTCDPDDMSIPSPAAWPIGPRLCRLSRRRELRLYGVLRSWSMLR